MKFANKFEDVALAKPIMIDTTQNAIVSHNSHTNGMLGCNEVINYGMIGPSDLGVVYNQGRWTQVEHLIFLACILQFGKDWKKIEFYVQTRSSSQARSHAQKVLKKMDKNAITKEIMRLKTKLKFDAKEHKCENLTALSQSFTNYAAFKNSTNGYTTAHQKQVQNKREIKFNSKLVSMQLAQILKDEQR